MGWAAHLIEQLKQGRVVVARPRGDSMSPRIRSGDEVEIRPLMSGECLKKGDIVLCRVAGAELLHLISAVRGERYQISNNHHWVNGWVGRSQIFGKLVRVGTRQVE